MMSSSPIYLDYEEILEHIGSLGRYQLMLFSLVGIFIWKFAANMVLTEFQIMQPRFTCSSSRLNIEEDDGNETAQAWAGPVLNSTSFLGDDRCWQDAGNTTDREACTDFVYDRSDWLETISTEWNLVCSRSSLEPLVFATYALGFGFGLVLGALADKFGRRPVVLISCAAELLLSLAECLAPNLPIYLALHFCHGVFATVGLLATVCAAEFVACRHRAAVANLLWLCWCLGYVSVAGLAYLVRHWRWLQLCACLPCACYAASYCLLQESPRWLLANGRNSEALRVCQKIARINRRTIPTATAELLTAQRPICQSQGHIKELFNTPVMLRKTLVLFLAWFAINLTYYGVSLDSGFIVAHNAFVSTALSGLIEAPAYVAAWLLAERLGRRTPSLAMYIGLGACLAALNLPERDSAAYSLIAIIAKLLVTCAFSVLIHYTAEICPTSVRNAGLLACSAVGRLAAVAAPFIVMNNGASVSRLAATISFGCVSVAAGLAIGAGLPETRGLPLMQTVQEANLATRGRESQFLDLIKKRRDDIAVYFAGHGDSANASGSTRSADPNQPETVASPAPSATAAAAAATADPANDDDPAVFFSSFKYLISPFT